MNTAQEKAEVERIKKKIRETGFASLTSVEQAVVAYSPYGYGGGCGSMTFASSIKAPDLPPSEAGEGDG
jgi:hypothetical protein